MYSSFPCFCNCLFCFIACFCVLCKQYALSPFAEAWKHAVTDTVGKFCGVHLRFKYHAIMFYIYQSSSTMQWITKLLKLCHINARSLLAYSNDYRSNSVKMDEIRFVLSESFEYDIIAISETWLTESTPNDSLKYLPNFYTIIRKDRQIPNSRGGGVAFYVSINIKAVPRLDLSSDNIELLWLEITTNNKTLLTGVCYRPPGQI